MSTAIDHIVKQYTDLQHGDCWIGVNFKNALHGIDAAKAAHKVSADTNSTWQLVNHLTYWRTIVVNRLEGSNDRPAFADFLLPDEVNESNWKQALLDFEAAYHLLIKTIKHFDEAYLHYPSPKKEQTYYELLLGALQHDAYHLGQIVLLKKEAFN